MEEGLDWERANRFIITSKTFRHVQISVTSIHYIVRRTYYVQKYLFWSFRNKLGFI